MKKKILLIGAGWEQYALIETIKKQGHTIIATHPAHNNDGFALADTFYIKDSRDIKAHLTIAETHQVDAVVTDNCDYSFYTASVEAAKYKLPFASIQSAIFSNDKFEQRESCHKAGVTQPLYKKVRSLEELNVAAQEIGFPVILKPVDSRGTFGVTIINDQSTLETAYYDAVDNSPSRILICEKFITGTLVTVDGFCFKNGHRSLAVASRVFEKGIKPVTKEIIYPAQFDEELNNRLLENHDKVATALNYQYGHTHGEYIVTPEKEIYLVECTNRGGGVFTSSVIVPLLTDINLNEILLNQSLGTDTFEIENRGLDFMKRSVMLTFLDFKVEGVIKTINIGEVLDLPYVVRYRSIYGENDMVESIENCASRHSMLVLKGDKASETYDNLQKFKSALKVEYYKM